MKNNHRLYQKVYVDKDRQPMAKNGEKQRFGKPQTES